MIPGVWLHGFHQRASILDNNGGGPHPQQDSCEPHFPIAKGTETVTRKQQKRTFTVSVSVFSVSASASDLDLCSGFRFLFPFLAWASVSVSVYVHCFGFGSCLRFLFLFSVTTPVSVTTSGCGSIFLLGVPPPSIFLQLGRNLVFYNASSPCSSLNGKDLVFGYFPFYLVISSLLLSLFRFRYSHFDWVFGPNLNYFPCFTPCLVFRFSQLLPASNIPHTLPLSLLFAAPWFAPPHLANPTLVDPACYLSPPTVLLLELYPKLLLSVHCSLWLPRRNNSIGWWKSQPFPWKPYSPLPIYFPASVQFCWSRLDFTVTRCRIFSLKNGGRKKYFKLLVFHVFDTFRNIEYNMEYNMELTDLPFHGSAVEFSRPWANEQMIAISIPRLMYYTYRHKLHKKIP